MIYFTGRQNGGAMLLVFVGLGVLFRLATSSFFSSKTRIEHEQQSSAPMTEHVAVKAWLKLNRKGPYPHRVVPLQTGETVNVYRLKGIGPADGDIVAKLANCPYVQRELLIYQEILPRAQILGPQVFGSVAQSKSMCWIFLDAVDGDEYRKSLYHDRLLVAEWLAKLHTGTQHVVEMVNMSSFPKQDSYLYLDHLRAGKQIIEENMDHDAALNATDRAMLHRTISHLTFIESHWSAVEKFIQSVPSVLVHGDFKPGNFRIRQDGVLIAFDWEVSGVGFPGMDLGVTEIDLDTYLHKLAEEWPTMNSANVTKMKEVGRILRRIAAIHWAARWLIAENHRGSSSSDPEGFRTHMEWMHLYEHTLAQSISSTSDNIFI